MKEEYMYGRSVGKAKGDLALCCGGYSAYWMR
jgi:hypothetical protein